MVYETKLPVVQLNDVVETFTISIEKIENNGASLVIMWDKSKIALPFTVNTKDKVLASIKKTMEGPSANDYHRSAAFYYQEKIDVKKHLNGLQKHAKCAQRHIDVAYKSLVTSGKRGF